MPSHGRVVAKGVVIAATVCAVAGTLALNSAAYATGPTTVDDTAVGTATNQIAYGGSWTTSTGTPKYLGSDHWSSTAGATAQVAFTGTSAVLDGAKAPYYGYASFSVDGGPATTVDLYAASRADQVPLFSTGTLTPAPHVVTMTVLGKHDSVATGSLVSLDRIDLTLATPVTASPTPTATTTTTSPAPTPVPTSTTAATGQVSLHSDSTHAFLRPDGSSLVLKSVNLQPVWSPTSTDTWPQARYNDIAARGFSGVRMVLFWNMFEQSQGAFNPTTFATLDTAVSRAKAAGLYVILDPIHLYGNMDKVPTWAQTGDTVTAVQTNGGNYIKYVAQRYRNEVAVAGYDLVNEPARWPIDQNGVLSMYNTLIGQVRSVDTEKIVLLEPTYGDTSIAPTFVDFSRLTNKHNAVWSYHDYFAAGSTNGYDPNNGSQQGTYVWNGTTGYTQPNATALESHLLVQLTNARNAGLPLWVGEFGIGDGVAGHDQWINEHVALFKKYGLSYTWWEYWSPDSFSSTNPDYTWKSWIGLVVG